MSPDPLEDNVARLVRESALPINDEVRSRARGEFLRVAGPAPRRLKVPALALAAAALLFCVVIYAATRPAPTPVCTTPDRGPAQEKAAEWIVIPGFPQEGGSADNVYKATLKMSGASRPLRKFRYEGRSALPEGTALKLTIEAKRERLDNRQLQPFCPKPPSVPLDVRKGGFEYEWEGAVTERILITLSAPDSLQDDAVLEKLKGTVEPMRFRSYLYFPFDERWPGLVEPQLLELGHFAREAGELFYRVEDACGSAEVFKTQEKTLTAEAERLQSRIEGFEAAGLYPASAQMLAYTVRDLAKSMKDFVWKDGKFDGTSSYYTPSKRGTTHSGDVFGFAELRRYKDEALSVAGREFILWIVVDFNRRGLQPDTFERILRMRNVPYVSDIASFVEMPAQNPPDAEVIRLIFSTLSESARKPLK